MTGVHNTPIFFSFEMGSPELPARDLPKPALLLISAFHRARVIGVRHWYPASSHLLI
jgi:hypothetical protein